MQTTRAQRAEVHRNKMQWKAEKRDRDFRNQVGRSWQYILPAGINRHTGKPHEHSREIARRQRQAASA